MWSSLVYTAMTAMLVSATLCMWMVVARVDNLAKGIRRLQSNEAAVQLKCAACECRYGLYCPQCEEKFVKMDRAALRRERIESLEKQLSDLAVLYRSSDVSRPVLIERYHAVYAQLRAFPEWHGEPDVDSQLPDAEMPRRREGFAEVSGLGKIVEAEQLPFGPESYCARCRCPVSHGICLNCDPFADAVRELSGRGCH